MKTAVIYARYSSTNQTEQSIEGQVHVCEDYAKKHDILIVDSYIDRAMSGTNDDRESFQQMLKDSNNKKWDFVLVYKLDRFARNKYESAIHRKHLKDNGIKLVSAMENIPDTPEGILMESLLEGMNQYFSEELAQKVARGLHESRMKGHCIGSVPYGYIKQKDKTLIVNEDEVSVIKRIFEEYINGKTILQISRDLEKEKITNKGGKFYPETIRNMIDRECYTGIYRLNNKIYDKIYPQIISIQMYNKAQEIRNKTRYGCRKDNHAIFRIKDKIQCGCCNRKMYPVSAISSNGQHLRFYKCISGKKNECNNHLIYKDFIEGIVDKFIPQQFNIPENLEEISNKIFELNKKLSSRNTILSSLKTQLQQVNTTLTNLVNAIEKVIYSETTKTRLLELEKQSKQLQEDIVIEESKQTIELSKEDIKNYFAYTMKQCPDRAIELFIKSVNVFDNKIQIQVNNAINMAQNDMQPTSKYLFQKKYITERIFKGGTTRTKTYTYDVYLLI